MIHTAVADYPLLAGSVNFRAKKSKLIGGKVGASTGETIQWDTNALPLTAVVQDATM